MASAAPSPPHRWISIRLLISAVTALALITAGAICISCTSLPAILQLRHLGSWQAAIRAEEALDRVLGLYRAPMAQVDTIANFTRHAGPTWSWPSSSPAALRAAIRTHTNAARTVIARSPATSLLYVGIYADNTAVVITADRRIRTLGVRCTERVQSLTPFPDPSNTSELGDFRNATQINSREVHDHMLLSSPNVDAALVAPIFDQGCVRNGTGGTALDIHASQPYLGRDGIVHGSQFAYYASVTLGGKIAISSTVIVLTAADGSLTPSLGVFSPLVVEDGPNRRNQLVGFNYVLTAYDTLNGELCTIAQQSGLTGWRVVVTNPRGFVLATSACGGSHGRFTSRPASDAELAQLVRARQSDDTGEACYSPMETTRHTLHASNLSTIYCVPHLRASPHPADRRIADELFPRGRGRSSAPDPFQGRKLDVDGAAYYASFAYATIGRYADFNPRIIALLPVADLIGDVMAANSIAIAISVVLVAVAAFVGAGVIVVVLRPLPRIAQGMADAAAMRDNTEEEERRRPQTCFEELFPLETAASDMHKELAQVRSFVPASVRSRAACSEADEDDLSDTATQSSHHRSRRESLASSRPSRAVLDVDSFVSSATASSSFAAAATTGSAYLRRGLTRRRVTVAVVHVPRVAEAMIGFRDADLVVAAASDLVRVITSGAKRFGGVLLLASGDTFTLTFNAVKKCSRHAVRACHAAMWFQRSLQRIAEGTRVGIGTGPCLVGNLGTAQAKAFTVLGPAADHARALERLVVMYGPGCFALASQGTLEDADGGVALGIVDLLPMPTASATTGSRVQPIVTVLQPTVSWHQASVENRYDQSHDGSRVQSFVGSMSVAACDGFANDNDDADAADQHEEMNDPVLEWLRMGLNAHASTQITSPLQQWNQACQLLLQGAAAQDVVNTSGGAMRLVEQQSASADISVAVDANAHIPSLMRHTKVEYRVPASRKKAPANSRPHVSPDAFLREFCSPPCGQRSSPGSGNLPHVPLAHCGQQPTALRDTRGSGAAELSASSGRR